MQTLEARHSYNVLKFSRNLKRVALTSRALGDAINVVHADPEDGKLANAAMLTLCHPRNLGALFTDHSLVHS